MLVNLKLKKEVEKLEQAMIDKAKKPQKRAREEPKQDQLDLVDRDAENYTEILESKVDDLERQLKEAKEERYEFEKKYREAVLPEFTLPLQLEEQDLK